MESLIIIFALWMLLIHWLTFWYWLRPYTKGNGAITQTMHSLWMAALACLFFLSYFILGCWLSALEWKGDL